MTPDAQLAETTRPLLGVVRQISKAQVRRVEAAPMRIIVTHDGAVVPPAVAIGDTAELLVVERARRDYLTALCHVLGGMAYVNEGTSTGDVERVLSRAREDLHMIGTTLERARP